MNSFRVVDTRFRILKGGKIGLSLSIALIAGMLTLGSTNAYSQIFFDGVTNGTTYTSGDISATAKSDTGISTANYSIVSSTESIIFKPERVVSSYIGVADYEVTGSLPTENSTLQGSMGTVTGSSQNIADGTYFNTPSTLTNYDLAYYQTFTPTNIFTVTLDSSATVNNIIKQTSDYYYVNNAATYTIQNDSYTANLVFTGSNTVSGTTSIDDGNIQLNGTASFAGAVSAGSIDVNTTSTITFNSAVDLSAGITDAMNFSQAGIVLLSDDFTGNVTTSDNLGTITIVGNGSGKEQIITGNIGTSTLSDINILNIGSDTVSSNYSRTVVNGNIYANSTVLNNGTTNSSTLFLSNGSNITSTITTADVNKGILTLEGSSTVTGTVGSTGKLAEVNSGATGSTSTFTGTVNTVNVTNTGTGSTTFQDDVTATTVNVNAGTTNFEKNLTATSTNITSGIGNFNTVSGATTSNIVFSGAGTANLYGDLTGNILTTLDNQGTVTFVGDVAGKSQTINGDIGSSLTTDVNILNIGESGVSSNYSTVTVTGNIFANSTVFNNGASSSTLLLADGKNITSTITTADANMGILTLSGTSTVSGQVGTNGNKLANVNAGATGKTATFSSDVYATNLNVTGTGAVDLNGSYTGTTLNYNADGTVNLADTKNITAAVTTTTNDTGTLNLAGTSTVSGQVGTNGNKLANVNAGATGKTATFSSDVYATNLNVTGTGAVDLNGSYTGTTLNYNADGTVNLADTKNITAAVTTTTNDTGTLNLAGTSTVSGQVGTNGNKLANVNAGATGKTATFSSDVYATNLNVTGTGEIKFKSDLTSDVIVLTSDNGVITFVGDTLGKTQNVTGNIGSSGNLINTLNIGESGGTGNYSKTIINGNVYATNTVLNNETSNNSTLELIDGKNITSTITTSNNTQGVLTFLGDSTATGTIGTNTEKLAQINAGATGKTVTFNSSVNADNLNFSGDGTIVLADNSNINAPITTAIDNQGTLTLNGTSTISGQVGTSTESLKVINTGVNSSNSTFSSDVYATNLNLTGDGIVNLNGTLTGDINFSGNNATVNVADGKGILGSVQTLANNTGILNYKGDGTISGNIGTSGLGIKELNINTNNDQNSTDGVLVTFDALGRELYADVVGLRNNATLTLSDNANMTNTGLDNILVTTDVTNTGTLTFQGTSNITGEVGESNKVLNTINAGATAEIVTFNDMVYATTLKYSGNGKVALNGDTVANTAEGMVGTVDLNNTTGTLAIGDNVNLTTGTSGIQFLNANSAILTFNGSSTVTGALGGNTAGNSTFERINAGADSSIVTFKNDVYVKESNDTTFHVSGTGTVNFEGDLIGDLIYDNLGDGIVNVSNGKSIIVSTVPVAVKTQTDNVGTLNFLGTTTLYSDIGTASKKLKNVTFASAGTSSDSYVMDLSKNIYAQNTYIGNSLNNTSINITDNITFGGNLEVKNNSILNVSDYDLTVADNLNIASNSTLKFKVYTTDISAGQAVENPKSGSITANSIILSSDTKINITYDGSWYGAGKYNLINATSSTGTYYGTELNGLVSDNSIIDSIVKNDGTNLTLFADRTGSGAYNPNDLYIVKSEIGNHYSNGASQALAGYANEAQREGALSDVIRRLEELDGGTVLTNAKKEEMIRTQKLLTPIANNSTIKSSLVATNTVLSTISDRISDIRVSSSMDFIPWGGDYSGLSSGDYMQDYALWIKAMGAKATQNKVKDYDGYETSTYGLVAGVDKTLRDGTTIGIAFAHSDTKINQTDFRAGDSSNTKSIQLSAYASKELGDAYVDGVLSYAKHTTEGSRTANSGKLTSSVDADQLSAKVETGYRVYLEDIATFTPFASFEYGTLNQKAYTEKGSVYQNDALKVANTKITKGNIGLGTKISANLNLGNVVIIPELKFGVYNAIGDKNADIKAQYTGGGNEFVTPTQDLTDTMYKAGIGIKTTLSQSTSLMLGVDYDRSKDGSFQGYSGNASFRLSF
ncbi:MAG: autotransporter domain-containing protein [Aliarcobacter sp.]|nr:autotransporter domain-containing protein [Aliarcobacter sp.]